MPLRSHAAGAGVASLAQLGGRSVLQESVAVRFQFRVTKYDPRFRDPSGAYMREEWTAVSDIGRTFGGVTLLPTSQRRARGGRTTGKRRTPSAACRDEQHRARCANFDPEVPGYMHQLRLGIEFDVEHRGQSGHRKRCPA